ncbi:hypothetical protein MTZ49_08890 [Entomomonas sp. E2T0]|uniref:hypothetical protein n=1 Tax=Entomomonas sp. E2T0 TaxID=2930213 RepID=UPI0022282CDD|nr:hypothetical protein [Entomomonas sp. E2T0]UYZ82731.1 hypothetical protein MTZ49_08890 [Entomomonas sp. E2T0]
MSVQNLKDAGCKEAFIAKYIDLQAKGNTAEQLRILLRHRCQLLELLHEKQKQIDCLDYLLYSLKKSRNGNSPQFFNK